MCFPGPPCTSEINCTECGHDLETLQIVILTLIRLMATKEQSVICFRFFLYWLYAIRGSSQELTCAPPQTKTELVSPKIRPAY